MSAISDKYKRDYKTGDYKNPRLAKDEDRRQQRKKKFILTAAVIFFLAIIYVILYSPIFVISKIEIIGAEKISANDIEAIVRQEMQGNRWWILPRNNFFIFSSKTVSDAIREQYWMENLTIKKKLFNRVLVEIAEKHPVASFLANNQCYQLDAYSNIIAYCAENNPSLIIKQSMPKSEYEIGELALTADLLSLIQHTQEALSGLNQFVIINFELTADQNLLVSTDKGVVIKFNLNDSISDQLNRLQILFQSAELKDKSNSLQYIDLRFGDKVYYK